MTETTDVPACGLRLRDGSMCIEPRDVADPEAVRCTRHEDLEFRLCAGCGGLGIRMCPECEIDVALCGDCAHRAWRDHGPKVHAPAGSPEKAQAISVRDNLVDALARALERRADADQIRLRSDPQLVADVLIDDLAAHALLALLGGMAAKGA